MNYAVHLRTSPFQHQQANKEPTSPTQELSLIQNEADLQQEFPDCFEGIGCFAEKYHITLKADAKLIIHPLWNCPIVMRSHVQAELECLECLKVICKVDEPTD